MSEIIINTNTNDLAYQFDKTNFNIKSFLNYYDVVVDKKVTGWMFPLDLVAFYYLLTNSLQTKGDICELGVAYGKSAIALSLFRTWDENLYLYDSFPAEITPEHAKNLVESYGRNDRINWNICDLMKLKYTDSPFENKLKFLHVDACHDHTYVLHDLNNFSKFVSDEGIISVDDFNDPEYPGINTAITEFILNEEGKDWRIFAIGQNKAYLCKKQNFYLIRNLFIKNVIAELRSIPLNFSEIMQYNVINLATKHPMSYEKVLEFLEKESQL